MSTGDLGDASVYNSEIRRVPKITPILSPLVYSDALEQPHNPLHLPTTVPTSKKTSGLQYLSIHSHATVSAARQVCWLRMTVTDFA